MGLYLQGNSEQTEGICHQGTKGGGRVNHEIHETHERGINNKGAKDMNEVKGAF
jgi:hypothetical protein